jgi:hypothetical protein
MLNYYMNLRERLLAHLREPSYQPANEFELSGRLGLNKKQRAMLAHEVRLALKSGNYVRAANGRISPRGAKAAEQRGPEKRPVFTPTRRGPAMPPPDQPPTFLAPTPKSSRESFSPTPRPSREPVASRKSSPVSTRAHRRRSHPQSPPRSNLPKAKSSAASNSAPAAPPSWCATLSWTKTPSPRSRFSPKTPGSPSPATACSPASIPVAKAAAPARRSAPSSASSNATATPSSAISARVAANMS